MADDVGISHCQLLAAMAAHISVALHACLCAVCRVQVMAGPQDAHVRHSISVPGHGAGPSAGVAAAAVAALTAAGETASLTPQVIYLDHLMHMVGNITDGRHQQHMVGST